MSGSFFKETLGARTAKRRVAPGGAGAARLEREAREAKRLVDDEDGDVGARRIVVGGVEIYDDVSVCRHLGLRRRVIAACRTIGTRGTDWDAIDEHIGMTKGWIERYCADKGIKPDYAALKRIKAGDGVVSVKLVGLHQNPCVCIVEVVATKMRGFAKIRNIYDYPIFRGECFDCLRIGDNLEWVAKLNEVEY